MTLCSLGTQLTVWPRCFSGAFEIEINGQLVFSKLENGGFPYEKDVSTGPAGSLCHLQAGLFLQ